MNAGILRGTGVALVEGVERLMHDVAAEVVMPRFRALSTDEIIEKAPGDLVTVADRLAEERIAERLHALMPEARMIGEEGVAADPSLLEGLGSGPAWIVDPIDGTHNYAEGKAPFAIMIGLIADGVTQAGWILDVPTGRMCRAVKGGGAFIDGEPLVARTSGEALPVVALAKQFLPDDLRTRFERNLSGRLTDVPVPRCAGEQYPRVALGRNDAATFWRAWPWDHAPGALILTEAGGHVSHFDGSPYRPAERKLGILAAGSPRMWDRIHAVLLG